MLITLCCIGFLTGMHAQNESYNLNNDLSTLIWQGSAALGSYNPQGTLQVSAGNITICSEKVYTMDITIAMKTLSQENTDLQEHLKNKDFFHVKTFPESTFVLSDAVPVKNGTVVLQGKMTIKGETLPENIPAKVVISEETVTLTFEHEIDRTRYGINYNSPSIFKRLKENAIADTFSIQGTLVFKK